MLSQKNMTKKKLENMHLQERIDHGYRTVIRMMLISGLFSIVVIGILFANMQHHIKNVTAARPGSKNLQNKCECGSEKYQGNGIE